MPAAYEASSYDVTHGKVIQTLAAHPGDRRCTAAWLNASALLVVLLRCNNKASTSRSCFSSAHSWGMFTESSD